MDVVVSKTDGSWHHKRFLAVAWQGAPLILAATFMVIGYVWHAAGATHPNNYHDYTFATRSYSDIIWLYLRDGLMQHRRPYLDFPLEYPVLLGAFSYFTSFTPSLPAYFAVSYASLAIAGLATVALCRRLPGVNPWYLAAAPALIFYTGLNWDLAAIFLTVLALVAYQHRADGWGTMALVAAIWFKFFPLPFLAAILIERLRERRLGSLLKICGIMVAGSLAINLPIAYVNWKNWSYFFAVSRDRPAEGGVWILFRHLTTAQINLLSAVILIAGGLIFTAVALRSKRPVTLPLGAGLLVLWLLINKVFSPQYALWVLLAMTLLAPSSALWTAYVAADIGYYYVSFLLLFATRFKNDQLSGWIDAGFRTPLELVRNVLLLTLLVFSLLVLTRHVPKRGDIVPLADDHDSDRAKPDKRYKD